LRGVDGRSLDYAQDDKVLLRSRYQPINAYNTTIAVLLSRPS
jgi:hypothetical protein